MVSVRITKIISYIRFLLTKIYQLLLLYHRCPNLITILTDDIAMNYWRFFHSVKNLSKLKYLSINQTDPNIVENCPILIYDLSDTQNLQAFILKFKSNEITTKVIKILFFKLF